jgi:undecaprenyl-diphosphatase
MSLWEAVLLGVIQGLTEFLPISSTAHLLVARQLMGHDDPRDAFTTAIQLGTLVAVFIYFRADLRRLAVAIFADLRAGRLATSPEARLVWLMAVATVPVVACGFLFKDFIKATLYNTSVIAGAAVVFALLLLAVELRARRRAGREETEVTWADAVFVGLFQAMALIPGASRSGVTITAGLASGLSRPAAARLSFLLSLPAILGAGIYDTYSDWHRLAGTGAGVVNLLVGGAVAAVVGYLSIAWLLGYLARHATYGFVVYRLVLAAALFAMLAAGWLKDKPDRGPGPGGRPEATARPSP